MMFRPKKQIVLLSLLLVIVCSVVYAREDIVYNFNIANNKDIEDSFTIGASNLVEYILIEQNPVIIAPKQTSAVKLTFAIPCSIEGLINLNLTVTPKSTGKTSKSPLTLNLPPCYTYSIQSGKSFTLREYTTDMGFEAYNETYSICQQEKTFIPILITNKLDKANTYTFNIDESFAKLNIEKLSLLPKQKAVFYVIAEPSDNKDKSLYFTVNSDYKDKQDFVMPLDIIECYSFEVDLDEKDSICNCEEKTYTIWVENKGISAELFNLSLKAPEWASLSQDSIELKPSNNTLIQLNVNPPCDLTGKHKIILSAVLASHPGISSQKELVLDVSPINQCYSGGIIAYDTRTGYYSKTVPIKIKNTGIKQTDYALALGAPPWITLTNNKLTINPGTTGTTNLKIEPTEDIEENSYKVTIKLQANKQETSKSINVVLKKPSEFFNKAKFWINYYKYNIVLAVVILLILSLSIYKIKKELPKIKKKIERAKQKAEKKRQKEEERRKEELKARKVAVEPKIGILFRKLAIIVLVLIILAAIIFGIIHYKLNQYINMVNPYLSYLISGIVILAALIIIIEVIRRKPAKIIKPKKVKELKKAEKRAKRKPKIKALKYYITFLVILVIAAILYFLNKQYKLLNYILKLAGPYSIYITTYIKNILIGFGVLIVLIIIISLFRKLKNLKKQKRRNAIRNLIIWLVILLILAAITFIIYKYDFVGYIKEFFINYYPYISAGFAVLIVLILILKYYKKLLKFLMEKD